MVARTLTIVILILTLTLISDTGSIAAPAAEMVYIVNSDQDAPDNDLGDGICLTVHGKCTLRAAIQEANRDLTVSKIKFASKMTIVDPTLEGLIEPFTVIDASDRWDGSWPSGRPGVIIGGGLYTSGVLIIQGDYAVVFGIEFFGGGSKGIVVNGSKGTIIGGTSPGQRNAFTTSYHASGSSMGVEVTNNATNTDIRSNYFGTFDGINVIINPGEYGIYLRSDRNTIRENIIVGHTMAGINIWLGNHNTITENYIGTDEFQTKSLPNQEGVVVYDSDDNQIGPYNVISGNTLDGVRVQISQNNLIVGNQIGTSTQPNGGNGIKIKSSNNNRVGIYIQNKIEANNGHGISVEYGNNNQIRLNTIYGNSKSGVHLKDATGNTIGGVNAYYGNVISKNGSQGVRLETGAHNNTVSGNYIGFSSAGAFDHGNASHGILIENGASDNRIGGLDPGEGNWIGWNNGSGIYITGGSTTGNLVEGNVIGAPVNWAWEAPNGHHGIGIYDGANGNWVGWFNTILASGWSGVVVVNSSNNVIWFNNIGTDGADIHWGNTFYGVHVFNSPGNLITSNNIHHNGLNGGEPGVLIEQTG
jgi:CSLREA domain-containing protein